MELVLSHFSGITNTKKAFNVRYF